MHKYAITAIRSKRKGGGGEGRRKKSQIVVRVVRHACTVKRTNWQLWTKVDRMTNLKHTHQLYSNYLDVFDYHVAIYFAFSIFDSAIKFNCLHIVMETYLYLESAKCYRYNQIFESRDLRHSRHSYKYTFDNSTPVLVCCPLTIHIYYGTSLQMQNIAVLDMSLQVQINHTIYVLYLLRNVEECSVWAHWLVHTIPTHFSYILFSCQKNN